MIKYAIYNQEKFKGGAFLPMLLALAKAFGSIMAEFGSAYLIVRAPTVAVCLVSFLGMSLIATIDDIMAKTITGADISGEISGTPIMYEKGKKSIYGDFEEIKEWLSDPSYSAVRFVLGFIMIVFNRIMTLTYIVVYFYFCPFLVILLLDYLKM
jgi:hypothetical protein